MRACARLRVSVCVSPPPKRIRGKRARRWINTKTSVTHDQPRPSSVSSSASTCAHRRALLRDDIGVALVLQDVHLDQYHWKLSKQIIDRAKKNPEAAHPDRPTNRTNRTRRYITHTGVAREETRKRKSTAPRREARKRETRSVLKNKKLPYIFQALTCAWVGWVGRWTERGSVGRREGPLRGEVGRAGVTSPRSPCTREERGYLRACLLPIGLPKLPRSQFTGRVFSAIFQN